MGWFILGWIVFLLGGFLGLCVLWDHVVDTWQNAGTYGTKEQRKRSKELGIDDY
jgi:hypothetical protein